MAALEQVEWSECLVPPRKDPEIEREFRKNYGIPLPVSPYIANSRWVAMALAKANYRNAQLAFMSCGLADLVFLAVSQDNSCRYCYAAQRTALRLQGFDEDRIRGIESTAGNPDRTEAAALDFSRRFSRANPPARADELQPLLDAGFSEDAAREIAYVAAYTVMGTRLSTLPAVPTQSLEAMPDRLTVRLVRPLLARVMNRATRTGTPAPVPDKLRSVPYAHVPLALEPLPCATTAAFFLDLAFRSGPLEAHTKDLVFAVIAKGVGSTRCESEARERLAAGGLAERVVDEALEHLGSRELDPRTNAILPYVRETIRPRPIDIQRRGRQLMDVLDPEGFIALVGTVAAANGFTRLSILLCES